MIIPFFKAYAKGINRTRTKSWPKITVTKSFFYLMGKENQLRLKLFLSHIARQSSIF